MNEKQVLSAHGIDATQSSGTKTKLGFVMIHRYGGSVRAVEVAVEQKLAKDAYWNITLGGNNLFSASQSVTVSGRAEIFYPDQNRFAAASALPVEFVMKASSNTANSTIDVSLLVERT